MIHGGRGKEGETVGLGSDLLSPLARLQTRQGDMVTTLCHTSVEISGALEKRLLQLLDGTRDRSMILQALEEAILSGAATLRQNGEPVHDAAKVRPLLAAELENQLNRLAKLGLLLAGDNGEAENLRQT
ncbi:MAG: hypothetical protein FJZ88_00070 [Chloroflexi bacterium]|nr:hypothetical protein [Chloroflexota bacterium]